MVFDNRKECLKSNKFSVFAIVLFENVVHITSIARRNYFLKSVHGFIEIREWKHICIVFHECKTIFIGIIQVKQETIEIDNGSHVQVPISENIGYVCRISRLIWLLDLLSFQKLSANNPLKIECKTKFNKKSVEKNVYVIRNQRFSAMIDENPYRYIKSIFRKNIDTSSKIS